MDQQLGDISDALRIQPHSLALPMGDRSEYDLVDFTSSIKMD